MNDFYLSSVLFSPFICIFLNGIHFHVHVRPNHEFFPRSFLFPVPVPLPQPVNIPTAIVTASTAVINFSSYDCPPLHCFHVYQRAVCVSIFVKQCHICHGISCCHLVFHVLAATLTCPRTVRYWQPCRFPVKHADASFIVYTSYRCKQIPQECFLPCCVAGYPVIFSCSFE